MSVNIKNIPNANSETYTPTSRATLDMGYNNTYRYVNTNSVPNTNSATYTPTWNGTHDLGATNTYRYVNTTSIYNAAVTFDNCKGHLHYYNRGCIDFSSSHTQTFTSATGNRLMAVIFAANAGSSWMQCVGIRLANGEGITSGIYDRSLTWNSDYSYTISASAYNIGTWIIEIYWS